MNLKHTNPRTAPVRRKSQYKTVLAIGVVPPPVSGSSVAFNSVLNAIRSANVRLAVVTLKTSTARDPSLLSKTTARLSFAALGAIQVARRPHVVYFNVGVSTPSWLADLPVLLAALVCRVPIVGHVHSGAFANWSATRWPGRLIRASYRSVAALLVLGEEQQRAASSVMPHARVYAVDNGVEAPCDPIEDDVWISTAASSPRILYVSSLMRSKGYLEVVRAVYLLRLAGTDVTGEICGSFAPDFAEADFDELQSRQEFLDLLATGEQGVVQYVGPVSGREKQAAFAAATFLVLPSTYRNEGLPLCVLEAMGAGVIPITTAIGSLAELAHRHPETLIVTAADSAAIASAIRNVLTDPAELLERRRRCRELFIARFTSERFTSTTLAHILKAARA